VFKKILVVVDDEKASQSAIRHAIEMASVHRADILFFYALPSYVFPGFDIIPVADLSPDEFHKKANAQAHKMLAAASELAERAGIHSFRSISSDTGDARGVATAARNKHCDLIVVGTESSNAVMRILNGSIVPGLISLATVPVLVCRDSVRLDAIGQRSSVSLRKMKTKLELLERRRREEND